MAASEPLENKISLATTAAKIAVVTARPDDNLRVFVQAACQHQSKHAPDLVRQKAGQNQEQIGPQLVHRNHNRPGAPSSPACDICK
jgi:hypothetical protein